MRDFGFSFLLSSCFFLVLTGCGAVGTKGTSTEQASAPSSHQALTHEAFVWQRRWSDDVRAAVRDSPGLGLSGLVALGAEIQHRDDGARVVRVPVDFAALEDAGPVALALRIGGLSRAPYPRDTVAQTAARLVEAARDAGVSVQEIQIDHDCPTRRLGECAELLQAVRERIAGTSLTFTALPSWLEDDDFVRLLNAADGYVLQVHSLELPEARDESGEPIPLCDPERARRAVERAARFGRAFRVALPTHSYVVRSRDGGFDADGEDFLSAASAREHGYVVSSDAEAMAALVRDWSHSRPRELTGLLWFRLPVDGDRFNWTAAALGGVIDGRAPERRVELRLRRPKEGLVEIDVVNDGQNNEKTPTRIELEWTAAPLTGDGLDGYRLSIDEKTLDASGHLHALLQPGEIRTLAWLRFAEPEPTIGARLGP